MLVLLMVEFELIGFICVCGCFFISLSLTFSRG